MSEQPRQPDLAALKSIALEEIAKKPIEALTLAGGVVSIVGLGLLNLMVSRYLAIFGQPGLSSFGDVANLLAALVPTTLLVVLLCACFVGLPIFGRHWSNGFGDHLLSGAFNWPEGREAGRRRALQTYGVLYGPLFACSALLCAMMFAPDAPWASPHWIWVALLVGLTIPAAFILQTVPTTDRGWTPFCGALGISLLLSLIALVWVTALGLVLAEFLRPTFENVNILQGGLIGGGVVVTLLVLHWLLTTVGGFRGGAALLFAGIVGLMLTVAPGDRIVTFTALRFANLGGGNVVFVRNTAAAAPSPACLVLSAGETLIVKLVGAADDCNAAAMQKPSPTYWKLLPASGRPSSHRFGSSTGKTSLVDHEASRSCDQELFLASKPPATCRRFNLPFRDLIGAAPVTQVTCLRSWGALLHDRSGPGLSPGACCA